MEEKKPRILIVEDDIGFGKILKEYLCLNGFDVVHTKDGIDGWNTLVNHHFDLCLLDVMMPKRDGIEMAELIRKEQKSVPIFFLTSKAGKEAMLQGYEAGADDYIVKPVDADILLHKIKATLKRSSAASIMPNEQNDFKIGAYDFNFLSRSLSINGQSESLSPKEAELLKALCCNINQLVKRDDILRNIWKEVTYFTGRSMDVYVVKLRKRLQHDANINIMNLHKSGYMLVIKEL
jgi:two-component system OmpR family response regulator